VGAARVVRQAVRGYEMNYLYLAVGLIALALFIYLVVALFKPESF